MFHCPVEATLSLIGGKYKPIILYHLIEKKLRFSELQRIMPQATQKMLTQQLRELEADKLIHREVFPVVPPKTEYSLTEYGQTLVPVLTAMCEWGKEHLSEYILPSAETLQVKNKNDGTNEE
jgi:DNA-binding HxlR family transcriptional regulator